MAFAPDGTLYFVDIHITCSAPLTNCGPVELRGSGHVRALRARSGTRGADHGRRALRLPDQRHDLCADQTGLPLPRSPDPVADAPRARPKGNDLVRPDLGDRLRAARRGVLVGDARGGGGLLGRGRDPDERPPPRRLRRPRCRPGAGRASATVRSTTSPGPPPSPTSTVGSLRQAWYFPTGDAVTATPTVVDGVAYVGSWDTKFYAVDVATGALRWSYQLDSQTGVTPYPGQQPRTDDSDGGLVTSTRLVRAGCGRPSESRHLRGWLHPLRHRRRHRTALLEARLRRAARAPPEPDHRPHPDLLVAHRRGRERLLRDEHGRAAG